MFETGKQYRLKSDVRSDVKADHIYASKSDLITIIAVGVDGIASVYTNDPASGFTVRVENLQDESDEIKAGDDLPLELLKVKGRSQKKAVVPDQQPSLF
jgi:hypothetical protein